MGDRQKELVEYREVKMKILEDVQNLIVFDSLPRLFRNAKELNSQACNDITEGLKLVESFWFFRNDPQYDLWEKHNGENYKQIMNTIDGNDANRFLITFGLMHKYWFENKLRNEKRVRFEPVYEKL